MADKFDVVDFVMAFESGEASNEYIIKGFQTMINDGTVWSLQGFYGRTASELIEQGFCKRANECTPEEAVENYKDYVANNC